LLAFALFLGLLSMLGRKRVWDDIGKVSIGAIAAFAGINVFYFLNVLPPIPLAMESIGIYHHIEHSGGVYRASGEPLPWTAKFGIAPVIHIKAGAPLYAFSAVYAPIKLKTKIVHRWQFHDPDKGWIDMGTIAFPITGGRDNGYRGFTVKSHLKEGRWRVDVDTVDDRVIGRIEFYVHTVTQEPRMTTQLLK
jgi:hypothetical protein